MYEPRKLSSVCTISLPRSLRPENPTLSLPCREVFARGQKDIVVEGPFPELESEIMAACAACYS